MFLGANSLANGIALPIGKDGASVVVRIRLASILGDEEALNGMWFTKGASGIIPCATLCSVTNKQRPQDVSDQIRSLNDLDDSIVDISCPDLHRCTPRSDEDVWKLCDILARCPQGELDEREHSTGLKFHPDTLLYCIPLRQFVLPSTHTTGDPMHILFSNGLLCGEIMLAMHYMKDTIGAYFANVRTFYESEGWTPGKKHKNTPMTSFSQAREKSSDQTLKCGSSEIMSDYPLLRAFILRVYGGAPREEPIQSLLCLFLVCDEIRTLLLGMTGAQAKRRATRLRDLVRQYLVAFKKAWGPSKFRFKHHQLLHVADWIIRLGIMLSCFVLERKHISAKRAIQSQNKHDKMCRFGLNGMLLSQLALLENPGWLNCLEQPVPYPEIATSLGARSASISRSMRFNCARAACNDVLFLDYARSYLVMVVGCVSFVTSIIYPVEEFGLIVRIGKRLSANDHNGSVWQVDDEPSFYRLSDEPFVHAAFYKRVSADRIEVLH